MYSSMDFLVYCPEREQLKLTLPMSFRQKFSSCAVIIDCFEVFIDRSSDLLARAQFKPGLHISIIIQQNI